MEWQKSLGDLSQGGSPLTSKLVNFSDLSRHDLEQFRPAWAEINAEHRRRIVARLVELAETNVELNYDGIFRLCLTDPDPEVRLKAIKGLEECEEPSLIDPLIDLLRSDPVERIRAVAATALGRFALLAELHKIRPHYGERIAEALTAVIDARAQPLEVRCRAVEAIAPLSLPQVTRIIEQAYHDSQQRMKISAIYAMGRNCDSRWLPLLIKELSHPDAEVRCQAVVACGEIGHPEAVHHLIPLLKDHETEVGEAAFLALGKIGGDDARFALREFRPSGNPRLKQAQEEALREARGSDESLFTGA